MPQTYSVKVLTDEDFNALAESNPRYEYVDQDNFGFADPSRSTAYVRHVAMPQLQKFLINHEFEHLLNPENYADRDPNGIYHKKGFGSLFGGPSKKKMERQMMEFQQQQQPTFGPPQGFDMQQRQPLGPPDTSWISRLDSPDSASPLAGGVAGGLVQEQGAMGRPVSGLRDALIKRGILQR